MAKTKIVTPLTEHEISQIWPAASRTWGTIASDAAQLGATSLTDAIELVLDAGRIVDIGKLDKTIYAKLNDLDWKSLSNLMKKNKNQWY